MADRGQVDVYLEISGEDRLVGVLRIYERRGQSITFEYATDFIRDPRSYEIDPALPLSTGVFRPPEGKALFNVFSDSAPDRWGQGLMRRQERDRARAAQTTPRTLGEADFLLGTRDELRQGAIRLRDPATNEYLAAEASGVPALVELPRLLAASDDVATDSPESDAIKDLIAAGGSLGGARPKASVRLRTGELAIAKFPRTSHDDWDVTGWEKVEAALAERAGIQTARSELVRVAGRHVLLIERFDREAGSRIGFSSALTMLEASDLESRSYLEIGEVIARFSPNPNSELEQLFRRIVFSILTSNTDDHLRNHGFLRTDHGWNLSPAYDMNPNPDGVGLQTTAIDLDDRTASIELALEVARHFRVTAGNAKAIVREVELATSVWREVAAGLGIRSSELSRMEAAYETSERVIARRLVV
jgi:serine/threonine-protein kinase HipA